MCDHLRNLNIHKSISLYKMYLRALRKLAKLLSMIFEKPLVTGKKKGNITSIFKQDRKDDPQNYQPVSLISVVRKVMEQILLEAMLRNMEERKVI